MNRTLFNVYSDVYTVALLRDIKHPVLVNKLPEGGEGTFRRLVKWFGRG